MNKERFYEIYKRQLKDKFNLTHSDAKIETKFKEFNGLAAEFGVDGDLAIEMESGEIVVLFEPRWDP